MRHRHDVHMVLVGDPPNSHGLRPSPPDPGSTTGAVAGMSEADAFFADLREE